MTNNWDAPLYLRCDCYSVQHAVVIERDPDIPDAVNVSVLGERNVSVWTRLKYAAQYVFGGEGFTAADVILNRDSGHRLRDFLNTVYPDDDSK